MSDQFRQWLTSEMKKQRLSQGALARAIEMSRPFVTRVVNGDNDPSVDFCIRAAQALGEAPEKVLRLAGILPPAQEGDTLQELLDLARSLSPEDQKDVLQYIRFRRQNPKN